MSYVAIYRKFRPQTFGQVKGQDSIVQTLQNQFRNGRIGHAYLFTGTRGTGKTSVARIFAKAINCLHPENGEPCNECENCKAISNGSFMDVIEIDAASNTGVDDIRRVIEEVQYTPATGKYKVYIIDEAHMLSSAASNAFLKTLEEPPAYAVFILATTEPHKLPVTILSRCQRYDFKRITTEKITENIFEYLSQEGIQAEEKAVRYIARIGDGSMRDALSLLDKAVAFNLGEVLTYDNTLAALGTVDTEVFSRMLRCVLSGDAYAAVTELDNEVKSGKDISRFINDFVWYLRNLLLLRVGDDKDPDMLGLSDENLKSLREDAKLAEAETLMRYIRILSELMNQLKFSTAKQVLADVGMIKLAKPQMETDSASVLDRIRQIEARLAQTGTSPVPQPKAAAPEFRAVYEDDSYINIDNYNEIFEAAPPVHTAPPVQTAPPAEPQQQAAPPAEPQPSVQAEPPKQAEPPAAPSHPAPAGDAGAVCANWGAIIADCTSPLLKVYLKETRAVFIDEKTIRIPVTSPMAENRLESKREEIEELIRARFGCKVNVQVSRGGKTPPAQEPIPAPAEQPSFPGVPRPAEVTAAPEKTLEEQEEEKIESLLQKNIKMNIETEDV